MTQAAIHQAMTAAAAHHRAARHRDAESICRQILTIQSNHPGALDLLAVIVAQAGRIDLAADFVRRAIAASPENPGYHFHLGTHLQTLEQFDAAIASYQRALALRPAYASAHANLGVVWHAKSNLDQAIACYQKALALKPNFIEAQYNLANAWRDKGEIDQAVVGYQRTLEIDAQCVDAHTNLALACFDTGRLDRAIAGFRNALALNPNLADAHSRLLSGLQYHPASDPQTLLAESQNWNRQHAQPLSLLSQPHANNRDPDRRLRVGYLSADFRFHSVSYFMLPLLASHNRAAVQVFCYAHVPAPDAMTVKLQTHADTWRSIVGLGDAQVVDMIRQDQIDILVDLAGHMAGNHLLVFAHKPAPVQMTFLGYPGTTGMTALDYRLTDALADPPALTDRFYSEQLLRLPRTAWCYRPPEDAPAVSELPALKNGWVTFGCFNYFAKVNEPLLKCWAGILRSVPGSRLRVRAKGLESASAQQMVRRVMAESGIDTARIDLSRRVSWTEHLTQYSQIDIALDTYPYHGTTMTCESLWMGIPVVTQAGQSHVSRVGVSLLSNVGLPELIAQSTEHYIKIATDLAADLPRLIDLRANLRRRMKDSPLMDAEHFARDVESAYRTMWRTWCQK